MAPSSLAVAVTVVSSARLETLATYFLDAGANVPMSTPLNVRPLSSDGVTVTVRIALTTGAPPVSSSAVTVPPGGAQPCSVSVVLCDVFPDDTATSSWRSLQSLSNPVLTLSVVTRMP